MKLDETNVLPGPLRHGDWVSTLVDRRPLTYEHHGIISYVPDTNPTADTVKVIHYWTEGSDSKLKIVETPLAAMLAGGSSLKVSAAEPAFDRSVVVERAKKYLGKGDNNLPVRNCEHFASYCFEGSAFSRQIYDYSIAGAVMGVVIAGISFGGILASRRPWN